MKRLEGSRRATGLAMSAAWLVPLLLGAVALFLDRSGAVEAQRRAERRAATDLRDAVATDVLASLRVGAPDFEHGFSAGTSSPDSGSRDYGPLRAAPRQSPRLVGDVEEPADEVAATLVALGELAESRGQASAAANHFTRARERADVGQWAPRAGLAAVRAFAAAGDVTTATELAREVADAHANRWIDLLSVPALCAVAAVRIARDAKLPAAVRDWQLRLLTGELPCDPRTVEPVLEALGIEAAEPAAARLLAAAKVLLTPEGERELDTVAATDGGGAALWTAERLVVYLPEDVAIAVRTSEADLRVEGFRVVLHGESNDALAVSEFPAFAIVPDGILPSERSRQAIAALVIAALVSLLVGQLAVQWLVRRTWRLARARSDFVDLVSHELRTPVAALTVKTEMLAAGDVPPAKVASYQRDVHAAARRLGDLVGRVLDFARLEKGRLPLEQRRLSVRNLVAAVVDAGCEALELSGQRLVVDVPRDLPDVEGDAEMLVRALRNLLDNAARHGRAESGQQEVRLGARIAANGVVIEIVDDGPGFGGVDPRQLIEPYRRGPKPRSAGSGLGLALAAQAVRAHGGRLELAERQPGPGAVSRVWLPYAKGVA